ncbi:hypothetical protein [Paractinoplanes globisporus]|uniref:Uncharacterized protein n=1 Tax=Paractinoplanes globisporus TaxID=113565 RepID=A0ABW6WEU6_9ACTN|nr:hypothetical protein [Actinoplanes globisporus]
MAVIRLLAARGATMQLRRIPGRDDCRSSRPAAAIPLNTAESHTGRDCGAPALRKDRRFAGCPVASARAANGMTTAPAMTIAINVRQIA